MKVTSNKLIFFVTTVVLALQSALSADAATVVFDNIAPSPPYYLNGGGIIGTIGTQSYITGTSFTPNATGQLDELTLGLFYVQGANSVTLRLSPDVGGAPSAPIWQGSGTPAPAYLQLMTMTGIGFFSSRRRFNLRCTEAAERPTFSPIASATSRVSCW